MSSAATFIVLKQNHYLNRFMEVGAISPGTAVGLEQAGCRDSHLFRRLVIRDVIRQTPQGKYYLDVDAARIFRKKRRERILAGVMIGLAIAAVLLLFFTKM